MKPSLLNDKNCIAHGSDKANISYPQCNTVYSHVAVSHQFTQRLFTRQMLAESWGEPEA